MGEASTTPECIHCKKKGEVVKLQKCAICFRYYCEDCAYNMSGRQFCGHFCAEYFFFAEPEDE